jgi:hypothetical protein
VKAAARPGVDQAEMSFMFCLELGHDEMERSGFAKFRANGDAA